MSKSTFDELYEKIKFEFKYQDTNMRKCIPGKERLAVTIRYLATGCSLTDLHYYYRIGVSTLCGIVQETCKILWERLKSESIPAPTEEKWQEIADGFNKNANFPNCIGALDGKHVRIVKPTSSGSLYYNYKKYMSVVLLAACDSNYNFTYVDIGSFGRNSDAGIFKDSTLCEALQSNKLNVPKPTPIGSDPNVKLPFVFVGDEAFGLAKNVLRPYGGKNLTVGKRVFNYRLSRARRYIECSFGILSNKWQIFHRPLNVGIEFSTDIIKACVILHNFVRSRDGYNFDDTLSCEGFVGIDEVNNVNGKQPREIRDLFAEFFVGEGNLPWQYNRI